MNNTFQVDIVGNNRIQEILEDPANFSLPAGRAEVIQDWIPNIGQKGMPFRCKHGVFRTDGLARSGVPSLLRHRFFERDEASRVIGEKYIGLLIYDSQEDDCAFELMAGSEYIGEIKPTRHDNRRHLIVCTKKAEILNGGVPFQIRASGTGPCYLEKVVYLAECPEGSSFAPEICRLGAKVVDRDSGGVTGELNFTTTEPAAAEVSGIDGETLRRIEELKVLHKISLHGLNDDTRYTMHITAREKEGASCEASIVLDTGRPVGITEKRISVPVELINLGSGDPSSLPLTFGVPIPAGHLYGSRAGKLLYEDGEAAVQTRVHSKWADGSARWILVDVPCPSGLQSGSSMHAELSVEPGQEPDQEAESFKGIVWTESGEGIVIDNGELKVKVSRDGSFPFSLEQTNGRDSRQSVVGKISGNLVIKLGNGLVLRNGTPEKPVLEETGTQRAVLRWEVPITDDRGIPHFRSTFRLHIYAGQSFVRVQHRLTVVSPALGTAMGADSLDHLTDDLEALRSAVVGTDNEPTSLLLVQSAELSLSLPEIKEIHFQDKTYSTTEAQKNWRLIQMHDQAFRIEHTAVENRKGRTTGGLELSSSSGSLVLNAKPFWQAYPKGIRVEKDSVTFEIFPEMEIESFPVYEEEWHRLYFWYDAERHQYKVKSGMAFTTELMIGLPEDSGDAERWSDWFEHPVAVRPDFDYLNKTGALLPMASKKDSPHPPFEKMVSRALDEWLEHRESGREYGYMNFGDTFKGSVRGGFWENNEYDSPFCHFIEFLRGGKPEWYRLGMEATRHLVDIDTCHYSLNPDQIGSQYMHMAGHVGGFLPPYFRNKMAGSTAVPSHMWIEGPALHYLLTGDESVRETLERAANWLQGNLVYYDVKNARECGWQIIHLCSLARLKDDPSCLNAASLLVETVLERQEPGGGWERPLTEAHCHCSPPRCYGEAGFMVGILLSALRRYYELEQDPGVAEAIVKGADWLIEKTYVPEAGHFRYTSCVNRDEGPRSACTAQILEGLADAYIFSGKPQILEIVERNIQYIGLTGEESVGRPRVGKALCHEARYIPFLLYGIQQIRAP